MSGEYVIAQMTVPSGVTISVTNSGGGPTDVTITPGTYTVADLVAELETQLNAQRPGASDPWTASIDANGIVEIELSDGVPWSIAWTSTALRDVLGYDADLAAIPGANSADKQARGLWLPHCSLMLDGDPAIAPRMDDGRASVSPTGTVFKVAGVTSYRHRNIRFTHVPRAYVWNELAAVENCAYERFYLDTQAGLGHPWFSPASRCSVGWDNGGSIELMGRDVSLWQFPSPQTLDELALGVAPWVGYVTVVLGDARSAG